MNLAQTQSWHALMDLHDRMGSGWTLIGGQLVHLHCAERGATPQRPTNDIDAVVDVRADPAALKKFTSALASMGFAPDTTGDGLQHRWRRELAQIDVLIPEGVGERSSLREGADGAPTLSAPGTTQALVRTERITVTVHGRTGTILRPTLVAALVGKAAARTDIAAARASAARHCSDFVVLSTLVSGRDFREVELKPKDRRRLRAMVALSRADLAAMSIEGAEVGLTRLSRAARLDD